MRTEHTHYLIRGGSIVDGTGSPPVQADLRVRDGVIAEIGEGLVPASDEREIDASGAYVTPGLIESHTHFDGTMWWQPDLNPLPGCGVTTVVMGNCGFALAPLHPDPEVQAQVVKIFSFFEDIPEEPFFDNLPWDWSTWSEYKDSMVEKVNVSANYGSFVGHIALRLAVMGMEAWERAARNVCGPTGLREAGGLQMASRNRACYDEAVSAAVSQVGSAQLASVSN